MTLATAGGTYAYISLKNRPISVPAILKTQEPINNAVLGSEVQKVTDTVTPVIDQVIKTVIETKNIKLSKEELQKIWDSAYEAIKKESTSSKATELKQAGITELEKLLGIPPRQDLECIK